MTDAERETLKRDYPHHWFTRVVRDGWSVIVAIPKREVPPVVPSMPGLTLDMLHGATINLKGVA